MFHIGGLRFGVPDPNDALMGGPPCINEENARLADVLIPGEISGLESNIMDPAQLKLYLGGAPFEKLR
jgi:hypothetical protein